MTGTENLIEDQEAALADLRNRLHGCTFEIEQDSDYPDFFSVFAYKDGVGAEIAGKIGELSIAKLLQGVLAQVGR